MGKRILLVEGKDDQHVMWNLLDVRGIPDSFEVVCPGVGRGTSDGGGVEQLLGSLVYRLASSELERLAVVLDANDKGPVARWNALRDRLIGGGYSDIPATLGEHGIVFELSLQPKTPRSVRFAAWVMPDNRRSGMLEDFVADLIREDDVMLPFVDRFLDSIPENKRRFSQAHHAKARIHSWLAVGQRPGRPIGQAIKADGQLDVNSETVQPFVDWLNRALITDGEQP